MKTLIEGAWALTLIAMKLGMVKKAVTSASTVSIKEFKTLSISSLSFLYSAVASCNFFPKRTFFLMFSGNSAVLLNLKSTSMPLKYRKNKKGGELANSGSIVSATFLAASPKSLFKDNLISALTLFKADAKSLFPPSNCPMNSSTV